MFLRRGIIYIPIRLEYLLLFNKNIPNFIRKHFDLPSRRLVGFCLNNLENKRIKYTGLTYNRGYECTASIYNIVYTYYFDRQYGDLKNLGLLYNVTRERVRVYLRHFVLKNFPRK